jgi:DNA modification methylase
MPNETRDCGNCGTTGVACAMLGKTFTGIERERKYFDIAVRRIKQAYAQPRLFDDPAAKKPQQLGMLDDYDLTDREAA